MSLFIIFAMLYLPILSTSFSSSLLCTHLIKLCSHIFQDATRIILHMATLHLCSTHQQGVLQIGEHTATHSCPWLMPMVLSTGATISAAMDYYIKIYPRTPPIHGLLLTCRGLITLLMLLQQWICSKLLPFSATTMKKSQVYICACTLFGT